MVPTTNDENCSSIHFLVMKQTLTILCSDRPGFSQGSGAMHFTLHGRTLQMVGQSRDIPLLKISALFFCLATYMTEVEDREKCSAMEEKCLLSDLPSEPVITVSSFLSNAEKTLAPEVWRYWRISIRACLDQEEQSLIMARCANGRPYTRLQVVINASRPLMTWLQQFTICLESRESLPQKLTVLVGSPSMKKRLFSDAHTYPGCFMELLPSRSTSKIMAYPFEVVEGWSRDCIIKGFQPTRSRAFKGQDS